MPEHLHTVTDDQPPEVDGDDMTSLPDLAAAAARINEYISWFGDGRIEIETDHPGQPGLFARDLFVVARAAEEVRSDG
ncbi:hypothetical protein AB0H76_15165 [Nocardia sp. NPDC050712]|uniref:hypothetical protein n=1 Tax=Nocardia sp. NPDC050712 TaxID=3155518 RepID=UPI0033E3290E